MIKFLDLNKINNRFHKSFLLEFNSFLNESQYILGEKLSVFETEYANYCGVKYCLGVANGLDALTLILKGYIELGKLKEGDKVIVPANTFIATILSVLHAGLEPVFIEPSLETYNLSSEAVKTAITADIKAIIVVHLYGQLADVDGLTKIASDHNLLLIEDAAQAHGATTKKGTKAGALGHAAAFSFYPSKNLGALGDGGAITTDDEDLFDIIKMLRNYGSHKKYVNEMIGVNSRLDSLQAGLLSIKLKYLENDNNKRREIARMYMDQITNDKIILPSVNSDNEHVFYAFVVRVEERKDFTDHLDAHSIGWMIHYPVAPHHQKALKNYNYLQLPITELIHDSIVSIPLNPVMTNDEVTTVINTLNNY